MYGKYGYTYSEKSPNFDKEFKEYVDLNYPQPTSKEEAIKVIEEIKQEMKILGRRLTLEHKLHKKYAYYYYKIYSGYNKEFAEWVDSNYPKKKTR